jgi:DNA-binding CsgD family transcriptional regulator
MKTYFISDDSFFLSGLEIALHGWHKNKYFINTGRPIAIWPDERDLLIVSIQDHIKRRTYLSNYKMYGARTIIITDLPIINLNEEPFPKIISKRITYNSLVEMLDGAKEKEANQRYVSRMDCQIIYMICNGNAMKEIANRNACSLKYLYGLKRKILIKHGLNNCNASGLLLCKDILSFT